MREIKFRQYIDPRNHYMYPDKKFHYWGYVEDENSFISPMGKSQASRSMQYTGLKDRNGVEIYEGDIVKHTYWRYPKVKTSELGVVSYCDREARFEFCLSLNTPLLELEVIGNMHENPELLENNNERDV